jgi:hypothetical protein
VNHRRHGAGRRAARRLRRDLIPVVSSQGLPAPSPGLNVAAGKVIGKLSARHRAVDFRDFLDQTAAGPAPAWTST